MRSIQLNKPNPRDQVRLIMAVGTHGQLLEPWDDAEYMRIFRRITQGAVVVVGYVTHRTMPSLPGQTVRCVDRKEKPEDVIQQYAGRTVWVAGGLATFSKWKPYANGHYIHYTHSPEPAKLFARVPWRRPSPEQILSD